MQITILLFDGVDLLDAGGPYEVFLTASRLQERSGLPAPFSVQNVTTDGEPVTAYGGLVLVPERASADVLLDPTVLLVPGTTDLTGPLADTELLAAIEGLASRSEVVASVCTGAFLLARAGLLSDRAWTTHWEDVEALEEIEGTANSRRGVRWVDSEEVVTSAGLTSGIDMALHLVERLTTSDLAMRTARQLEYTWEAGLSRATDWERPD